MEWLYQLPRRKGLSASAVRVGLLFGTFLQSDDREEVSPGYDWIMTNAHLSSRTTVSKALAELEKDGMLCVERTHRYRNHYHLPFDGEEEWKPDC